MCNCDLCRAPRRSRDEAERLAEAYMDGYTAELAFGETFDPYPVLDEVQANLRKDPAYAAALLDLVARRGNHLY